MTAQPLSDTHTKGPWWFDAEIAPASSAYTIHGVSNHGKRQRSLARVNKLDSEPAAEGRANARLIAAAPDLLKEGRALLEKVDDLAAAYAEPLLFEEREALRAAILKAQQGTQVSNTGGERRNNEIKDVPND